MSTYKGLFNTTAIEGCDEAYIVDLECDNLVVNDSVSLPNLSITDNEIVSVSGNKIIDPLRINNIYEKSPGSKITFNNITQFLGSADIELNTILKVFGNVEFYDQYDTHKVNLDLMNFQELDRDCRLLFPQDIATTDEFTLSSTAARLYNKDISTGCTIVDSTTFLNDPVILKTFKFDGSGLTINNLRTMTIPNASGTLVLNDNTATLTNKSIDGLTNTLTNIQDSSLSANVLTTSNTKTVTNKSIDGLTNTLTNIQDASLSANVLTTTNSKTVTNKSIDGLTNTLTNIQDASLSTNVLTTTNTKTLTNKSISGSTNTITNIQDSSLSSEVVLKTAVQTVENKTLYASYIDACLFQDFLDKTKKFKWDLSTITTATTRTIGVPNTSDEMVLKDFAQTLTNKTLTSPIISTISNSGTITLPTGTRTLVARDTTDTLTNKTLTSPIISTISNTGTLTLPTSTDTLVGRATTDTLTNKTLSAAVFSGSASGTLQTSGQIYTTNTGTGSITTLGGIAATGNISCGFYTGYNTITDYYACCLHNNGTNQTLTTGVATLMTLSTTLFNSGSNTAVNLTAGNMYIQCPFTGFYNIYAQAYFTSASALTYERLQIQTTTGTPNVASDTILRQQIDRIATDCCMNISFVHYMTSGDRIYCGVQCNATTPRLSNSTVATRCYLGIHFLGKII
jgi:hypothetical protein